MSAASAGALQARMAGATKPIKYRLLFMGSNPSVGERGGEPGAIVRSLCYSHVTFVICKKYLTNQMFVTLRRPRARPGRRLAGEQGPARADPGKTHRHLLGGQGPGTEAHPGIGRGGEVARLRVIVAVVSAAGIFSRLGGAHDSA